MTVAVAVRWQRRRRRNSRRSRRRPRARPRSAWRDPGTGVAGRRPATADAAAERQGGHRSPFAGMNQIRFVGSARDAPSQPLGDSPDCGYGPPATLPRFAATRSTQRRLLERAVLAARARAAAPRVGRATPRAGDRRALRGGQDPTLAQASSPSCSASAPDRSSALEDLYGGWDGLEDGRPAALLPCRSAVLAPAGRRQGRAAPWSVAALLTGAGAPALAHGRVLLVSIAASRTRADHRGRGRSAARERRARQAWVLRAGACSSVARARRGRRPSSARCSAATASSTRPHWQQRWARQEQAASSLITRLRAPFATACSRLAVRARRVLVMRRRAGAEWRVDRRRLQIRHRRRAQLPQRLDDAVEGDHDRLPARRVRRTAAERLLQQPVRHPRAGRREARRELGVGA